MSDIIHEVDGQELIKANNGNINSKYYNTIIAIRDSIQRSNIFHQNFCIDSKYNNCFIDKYTERKNLINLFEAYVKNFVAYYSDKTNGSTKDEELYTLSNIVINGNSIDSLLQNKHDNEKNVIKNLISYYNSIITSIVELLKKIDRARTPEDIRNILLDIVNDGIDYNVIKYAFSTIQDKLKNKADIILRNYGLREEGRNILSEQFDDNKDENEDIIKLMNDLGKSKQYNPKQYNYEQMLTNVKTYLINYKKEYRQGIDSTIDNKNEIAASKDTATKNQENATKKINYIEQHKDKEGRTILYYLDKCFEYEYKEGRYDDFIKKLENLAGGEGELIKLCNQRDIYGLTPLEYILSNPKSSRNCLSEEGTAWSVAIKQLCDLLEKENVKLNLDNLKNDIKNYLTLRGEFERDKYNVICYEIDRNIHIKKLCGIEQEEDNSTELEENNVDITKTRNQLDLTQARFIKTSQSTKRTTAGNNGNNTNEFKFLDTPVSKITINRKEFNRDNFADDENIMKQQLQEIVNKIPMQQMGSQKPNNDSICKCVFENGIPTIICPYLNIDFGEDKTLKININYDGMFNGNEKDIKSKKEEFKKFFKYYFQYFKDIDNFSMDENGNKRYCNNETFNTEGLGNYYKESYDKIKEKVIGYLGEGGNKEFYSILAECLQDSNVSSNFQVGNTESANKSYKYLYRYVLQDYIDNTTIGECCNELINGRGAICEDKKTNSAKETKEYVINRFLNKILSTSNNDVINNIKSYISSQGVFGNNKKLVDMFMKLFNNIQLLKLNVQRDDHAKKFAKLIDEINLGLSEIGKNTGFNILSLYENNSIVDFVNNIKVDDEQTIEQLILSKRKQQPILGQQKQNIKARRKQIILNRDSLLLSNTVDVYKQQIKKIKKQKNDQINTSLVMGVNEMNEITQNGTNNSVIIRD